MKHFHLKNMLKGWFIGNFEPTVLRTSDFEIGIKEYKAGQSEEWHYHKIAKEITTVISGQVEMGGKTFSKGDIVVLEPGEGTEFKALSDATVMAVKVPSVPHDKFGKEAKDSRRA